MRNTYLESILRALDGSLDPALFEKYIPDLLRGEYPRLVPVPGGQDRGWDGAVSNEEGGWFPVICTTAIDFKRNFRESLDSLRTAEPPRKVVFATSREVNQKTREELRDTARDKSFVLLQVHGRADLALRLYRNSSVCQQLLGLTGEPEALSPIPPTHRAQVALPLIGRESDLAWLEETSGDRILTGQPGSGKTFLISELVEKGWGLFLNPSATDAQIANELRDKRPPIVVVDDAHALPQKLVRLRHLRQQLFQDDRSFDIVAACWPGFARSISDELGSIDKGSTRQLELLTRPQILQLLDHLGVEASEDWRRELTDQAANKPGLAVVLGMAWLRGDFQEIVRGEALLNSLAASLEHHAAHAVDILACFALAGDRGLNWDAVSDFLEISKADLRSAVTQLATAGVLNEARGGALSVWPRQLRAPLLNDAFFEGTARYDYESLLDRVKNRDDSLQELIRARDRGGAIPLLALQQLLDRTQAKKPWISFALLGREEATWSMDRYRGNPLDLAKPSLLQAPEAALQRLLAIALETGEASAERRQIVQSIRNWIEWLRQPDFVERRCALATVLLQTDLVEKDPSLAWVFARFSLSPRLSDSYSDAGEGMTATITSGRLGVAALGHMEGILEDLEPLVQASCEHWDREDWSGFDSLVHGLAHPEYLVPGSKTNAEERAAYRSFLGKLLVIVAGAPNLAAGHRVGLTRWARRLEIELELEVDPLFELLYPEGWDWLRDDDAATSRLDDLARAWAAEPPEDVAERLLDYEREADRVGVSWPRRSRRLVAALVTLAGKPIAIYDALTDRDHHHPQMAEPALEAVIEQRADGWQLRLRRALESQQYRALALEKILIKSEMPADLLGAALELISDQQHVIEPLALRGEISVAVLNRLLRHPDKNVALATAVGEWNASPRGEVRSEVEPAWREAILQAPAPDSGDGLEYWLGDILSGDGELAEDWLRCRLRESLEAWSAPLPNDPLLRAVQALGRGQRLELLGRLSMRQAGLIPALVDGHPDVYRALLARPELEGAHYWPLKREIDDTWKSLVRTAVAEGGSLLRIAREGIQPASVYSPLTYWAETARRLRDLDDDKDLAEFARMALEEAETRLQREQEVQRRQQLRGVGS